MLSNVDFDKSLGWVSNPQPPAYEADALPLSYQGIILRIDSL